MGQFYKRLQVKGADELVLASGNNREIKSSGIDPMLINTAMNQLERLDDIETRITNLEDITDGV